MENPANQAADGRPTASVLGMSIHTVSAWIAQRRLNYVRLGRAIRVLPAEIERLLISSAVLGLDGTHREERFQHLQVIDVWWELDPRHNRLVKLRTEAARQKLQGEIRIETIQIRFNNRENLNSGIIPSQILAMNLRKIDELAAQYYSIYSEVWELRGNEKSAALVRTIYSHVLRRLIAIRKTSVAHEAQRSAIGTGCLDSRATLRIESFNRLADQLTRDWAKKIEIEGLELEARARSRPSRSEARLALPTAILDMPTTEIASPPVSGQMQSALEGRVSKGVREGKTVEELYRHLKRVRSIYRNKGLSASQIRNSTIQELAVLWEWVDRIDAANAKTEFMDVREWDDGDEFIFRQIATLYELAPHLSKKPSWSTLRDWRKAFRGYVRHKTPDGRKPHF